MNENENPFAGRPAASKRADARRHIGFAAGAAAAIVVAFFGWVTFRQQAQNLESVRSELEATRAMAARSQSEAAELRGKLSDSKSRVADLEKEKEMAGQMHKGLEEEMRAALESKDVTISQLQGKLTVNILDRILFESGEAVLKPAGEAVLQKIAGILAQHPALKIHVIGHTDNVPIRASARVRYASNWELSTARALAACASSRKPPGWIRVVWAPLATENFVLSPTMPRRKAAPKTAALRSASLPMNWSGPIPFQR